MDWLPIMTTAEILLIEEVCGSQPPRWLPAIPMLVLSPPTSYQGWYSRSDGMSPLIQVFKDTKVAILVAPSLREASYHVVSSHSYKEAQMRRNSGLCPKANKEVKPANNHQRELESRSCSPVKPSDNQRLSRHLECNLVRDTDPDPTG